MATKKKTGTGMGVKSAVGIIAAAAAASAAGYYFYASKDASKNRKIAAKWANDMKKEVIKKAKQVKALDSKAMAVIVDEAASAYHKIRSIDKADIANASAELKKNWQSIAKELGTATGAAKKKTTKVVVKATKKIVSKAKKTVK